MWFKTQFKIISHYRGLRDWKVYEKSFPSMQDLPIKPISTTVSVNVPTLCHIMPFVFFLVDLKKKSISTEPHTWRDVLQDKKLYLDILWHWKLHISVEIFIYRLSICNNNPLLVKHKTSGNLLYRCKIIPMISAFRRAH